VTVWRGVVTIGPVFRERQSPRKAFQRNNIGPLVTVVTLVTVLASNHGRGLLTLRRNKPVDLVPLRPLQILGLPRVTTVTFSVSHCRVDRYA